MHAHGMLLSRQADDMLGGFDRTPVVHADLSRSCAPAFHLCWSPTEVPLTELVRVAGARWSVEECFQAAKSEVGLDHYRVRHGTSWHRHITLAMLALALLAALAADAALELPTDTDRFIRSRDPITLTVPETRHLLVAVFTPPTMTAARLLHLSNWRRRHHRRRSAGERAG